MRGRDETYPPSDCVGEVEGEVPRHPVTAVGGLFFERLRTTLMDTLQAESFALQKQTNLVFYAFGIWHSKTRVSRGLWDGRQSSGVLMNTHASSSRFPPSASMFLT